MKCKVAASVLISIFMISCGGVKRQPRNITFCPPPQPAPCSPVRFSPADDPQTPAGYRYSTYAVRGANSDDHEWSLAFVSGNSSAFASGGTVRLSMEHDKRGYVMQGKWVQFDSVFTDAELQLPMRGDAGICASGSMNLITLYAFGKNEADADVVGVQDGELLELSGLQQEGTWDAHPAATADNRIVFFSSDREGGVGGCDIWYTLRNDNGTWCDARNAGPAINTACDELTPFVSTDGSRLLFASRGHSSMGGYDIFSSGIDLQKPNSADTALPSLTFSEARNMGSTVNSAADELSPSTMTGEAELLYFSSNRRSRFDFDMYVRRREMQKQQNISSRAAATTPTARAALPDTIELRGRVTDKNQQGISGAEVSARDVARDSIVARTVTDTNGLYNLRVRSDITVDIVAQSKRGFFDARRFTPQKGDTSVMVFTVPEVLELRVNFPSDEDRVPYDFVLDTNGSETDQKWSLAIDRIAENLKKFSGTGTIVQLVGHTDKNGTNAYNEALGKRRVKFVVDELVKRGLPAAMFKGRSAGEREPLARRPAEDDAAYDKRNRRVELSKLNR